MADGTNKEKAVEQRFTVEKTYVRVPAPPEKPDVFPPGSQYRMNVVAMALMGAAKVFQEICDGSTEHCGVSGILDLAIDELTRINNEFEEYEPQAASKKEARNLRDGFSAAGREECPGSSQEGEYGRAEVSDDAGKEERSVCVRHVFRGKSSI